MSLPLEHRFAKERARFCSFCLVKDLGSRRCRVIPSVRNMARSPSFQAFILVQDSWAESNQLRSKQAICSFTFVLWWGFCRAKIGRTVLAIRATDSRADPAAKALYSLASSATKDLPTFPDGSLKQFYLQ